MQNQIYELLLKMNKDIQGVKEDTQEIKEIVNSIESNQIELVKQLSV
ncbi:hypothetical protein [Niallia circulans]|uniref:Uncharacterized protein n=1 Tax=Niallia circulans TaxID=1397 RepID=A0A941G9M3_NIACI|nr:hypothetical protein [Niallia circulans]MCB5235900.1 hypothetical protein [Niallia circulans]